MRKSPFADELSCPVGAHCVLGEGGLGSPFSKLESSGGAVLPPSHPMIAVWGDVGEGEGRSEVVEGAARPLVLDDEGAAGELFGDSGAFVRFSIDSFGIAKKEMRDGFQTEAQGCAMPWEWRSGKTDGGDVDAESTKGKTRSSFPENHALDAGSKVHARKMELPVLLLLLR